MAVAADADRSCAAVFGKARNKYRLIKNKKNKPQTEPNHHPSESMLTEWSCAMLRALWVELIAEADYRAGRELKMHIHSSVYLKEIITITYLLNTYCVLRKRGSQTCLMPFPLDSHLLFTNQSGLPSYSHCWPLENSFCLYFSHISPHGLPPTESAHLTQQQQSTENRNRVSIHLPAAP